MIGIAKQSTLRLVAKNGWYELEHQLIFDFTVQVVDLLCQLLVKSTQVLTIHQWPSLPFVPWTRDMFLEGIMETATRINILKGEFGIEGEHTICPEWYSI